MKGVVNIKVLDKNGEVKYSEEGKNVILPTYKNYVSTAIRNQSIVATKGFSAPSSLYFRNIKLYSTRIGEESGSFIADDACSDMGVNRLCGSTEYSVSTGNRNYTRGNALDSGKVLTTSWTWADIEKSFDLKSLALCGSLVNRSGSFSLKFIDNETGEIYHLVQHQAQSLSSSPDYTVDRGIFYNKYINSISFYFKFNYLAGGILPLYNPTRYFVISDGNYYIYNTHHLVDNSTDPIFTTPSLFNFYTGMTIIVPTPEADYLILHGRSQSSTIYKTYFYKLPREEGEDIYKFNTEFESNVDSLECFVVGRLLHIGKANSDCIEIYFKGIDQNNELILDSSIGKMYPLYSVSNYVAHDYKFILRDPILYPNYREQGCSVLVANRNTSSPYTYWFNSCEYQPISNTTAYNLNTPVHVKGADEVEEGEPTDTVVVTYSIIFGE